MSSAPRPTLMLAISGTAREGFEAHNANRDNRGLKTCYSCGGDNVRAMNRFNPHYWVECGDCGTQGPYGDPAQPYEGLIDSVVLCRRLHQQAFDNAVDGWNRTPARRLIE